ncbi:MAG: Acetolactate synthase, mitochondrial [Chaenotheca gracillima]|nr:MAG: Acetolactate synthase, mitochondrial [Chaenotheca gracillima]
MASRALSRRALQAPSAARGSWQRSSSVQQQTRGFVNALGAAGAARVSPAKTAAVPLVQKAQRRGIKTIDFAGTKEIVYERDDWPREKLLDYFKNDTLALIGYGSQGHGQGLNLRDNGLNVIIGVRKNGASWKEAQQDGWVPGTNLFDVDEAISKGTIVMNLLSDAAQSETWPAIKPQLTKGKTLYFSHGFSPVFKDLTKVDVPKDIDVILVAPKGSGRTVRTLFREGRGINSSIAVYQDVTGKAEEKAVALGVAVGSGYLYKTTFEKEVYSDLYGERGCLMGGIHGMFLAQYEVLRERGHSPSEAFNETVEEATQSLYPLIGANGMDWMYAACSTTARRGAIDWSSKFKDSLKPVFNDLYDSVKNGTETQRSLDYNSQPDYREKYEAEMAEIRNMEIWRAGKAVRHEHVNPTIPSPFDGFDCEFMASLAAVPLYEEYSLDSAIAEFFEQTSATREACDTKAKDLVGGRIVPVTLQGNCSYSVYAGPELEFVVQFRLKSLLITTEIASLAQKIYGSLAPSISFHGQLGDGCKEPVFIYVMTRIRGVSLLDFTLANGFPENSDAIFLWRKTLMSDVARFFAYSWNHPQVVDSDYRETLRQTYVKELGDATPLLARSLSSDRSKLS